MSMLRYSQDSIMVMSAYSAVFMLRLFRNPVTYAHLSESTAHEIYDLISQTADAYHDASSPASTSAAYHSRFLRSLITEDVAKPRRTEKRKENSMPIDPRLQVASTSYTAVQNPTYNHQMQHVSDHSFPFNPSSYSLNTHSNAYTTDSPVRNGSISGNIHTTASVNYNTGFVPAAPHHASAEDAHYWRHMFLELGYGSGDPNPERPIPYTPESGSQIQHQGQIQYHQMPSYGH